MRIGQAAAFAAGMTASIAWTTLAWAAPVDLEIRGCDDEGAVRAAARVELADAGASMARVTVVCLEGARALVVAFPRDGTRPVARELAVDDVASSSRARAVAIALAELVREATTTPARPDAAVASPPSQPGPTPPPTPSAWVMPTTRPEPVVVMVSAPATEERAASGWTVGASLHLRGFAPDGTFTIGPTVELDAPLGDPALRVRGAGHLGLAEARTAVGTATVTTWTGSVSLLARIDSASIGLDAGPLVQLGVATAEGTPAAGLSIESTTTTAPILLAGGQVVIGGRTASFLVPHLAVDAGGVLAGITADVDADRALAIAGLFVGVRAGLAIGPAPSPP